MDLDPVTFVEIQTDYAIRSCCRDFGNTVLDRRATNPDRLIPRAKTGPRLGVNAPRGKQINFFEVFRVGVSAAVTKKIAAHGGGVRLRCQTRQDQPASLGG